MSVALAVGTIFELSRNDIRNDHIHSYWNIYLQISLVSPFPTFSRARATCRWFSAVARCWSRTWMATSIVTISGSTFPVAAVRCLHARVESHFKDILLEHQCISINAKGAMQWLCQLWKCLTLPVLVHCSLYVIVFYCNSLCCLGFKLTACLQSSPRLSCAGSIGTLWAGAMGVSTSTSIVGEVHKFTVETKVACFQHSQMMHFIMIVWSRLPLTKA